MGLVKFMGLLTLLLPPDDVLEEVDGDALRRRQICLGIDGEELVHLVLGAELRGELCGGDALLGGGRDLHRGYSN